MGNSCLPTVWATLATLTLNLSPSNILDKGQALLLAYMLVIVSNGPVENFNYNTQVLATSALCAQQQLIESSGDLIDFLQRPLLGKVS